MNDDEVEVKVAMLQLSEAKEKLRELEGPSLGPPYCSFCQRGKGQYSCCIEGPSNVRICDSCVMEAYGMVTVELKDEQ